MTNRNYYNLIDEDPKIHLPLTNHITTISFGLSTNNYKYPAIKVVKPSQRGIPLIKVAKNIIGLPKDSVQQQESMLIKLIQLLASKKSQIDGYQRQALKKIIFGLNENNILLLPLKNLKLFIELYIFCKEKMIIFKAIHLETLLYREIVRRIEQIQNIEQQWSELIKFYQIVSIFQVHLHDQLCKIPKIFNSNHNQKWKCKIENMLPIIRGLYKRQYLFTDQRSSLVKILAISNRIYHELAPSHKIQIVKEVIKVNSLQRYGFKILAQEELLASFCKDLQNAKIKIWEEKAYEVIQNNIPPSQKAIQSIEKIIFKEVIQQFGKNKDKISDQVIDAFYFVLAHYAKKNQYSALSESEKTLIFQFFTRELEKPKMIGVQSAIQPLISNMISYDFFGSHIQSVKYLIISIPNLKITPQLYLQLTLSGVSLDEQFLQTLQKDGARIVRMNVKKQMDYTDIMILLASKMQYVINFNNQYFNTVFSKYLQQFKQQIKINPIRMLRQISKLSSVTLYYLFRQCSIDQAIAQIQSNQFSQNVKQKHTYLHIILKYMSYQELVKSHHFSLQDEKLFLYIVHQELKIKSNMHYYSSCIFTYFSKMVQFHHNKKCSFVILTAMGKMFDIMSQITSLLRDRRLSVLDSNLFVLYWQLILSFMDKLKQLSLVSLWNIKLKQLISQIINTDQGYFPQAPQYSELLKILFQNLVKLQPNNDLINQIVVKCIYSGELNATNCKEYIWQIKRVLNLKGQTKQIMDAWIAECEGQQPIQSDFLITKFIAKTVNFNPQEISLQKQKYKEEQYASIMKLFNLPLESRYQRVYLDLFYELRKRTFKINSLNFVIITEKLFRFNYCSQFAAQFQEKGGAKIILKGVLASHRNDFKNLRLQYTQNLIRNIGKMMVFDRDYERLMLQRLYLQQCEPSIISACLTTLIKHQFGFNYKDLRKVENIMKSTANHVMLPFLMLEQQMIQENKKQILKKMLKTQENDSINENQELNNQLVHNYFKKKYHQFYHQSLFASKYKSTTFVGKPNILLQVKYFTPLIKLFEDQDAIKTYSILGNQLLIIKPNIGLGFFTHKKLPVEIKMMRKLLLCESTEITELFAVRVTLKPQNIITEIIEECNLIVTDQKKKEVLLEFKKSFAEYWQNQSKM